MKVILLSLKKLLQLKINGLSSDMKTRITVSWTGTTAFRRVDCYPDASTGSSADCEMRGWED